MKLSMTDPTSSGLLTHINSSKFLATLFILSEVLPITAEVSKLFQADVVSYSSIEPGLTFIKQKLEDINTSQSPTKAYNEFVGSESVAELLNFDVEKTAPFGRKVRSDDLMPIEDFMKDLLRVYTSSLITNIEDRFKETLPLLNALGVFNPLLIPDDTTQLSRHGAKEINIIADHFATGIERFTSEESRQKKEKILVEWQRLKYDLKSWKAIIPDEVKSGRRSQNEMEGGIHQRKPLTPTQWALDRLMRMRCELGHLYPELQFIAEVIISLPVSNAWPERGASKVKLIKTRLRSSMKNDLLNASIIVQINGPDLFTDDCDKLITRAIARWNGAKQRRKKIKKSSSMTTSTASNHVETTEISTQTESDTDEHHDKILSLFIGSDEMADPACSDVGSDYESDFEF